MKARNINSKRKITLKNGVEILDKFAATKLFVFPDDIDVNNPELSIEENKKGIRSCLYVLHDNYKKITELIYFLYEAGFYKKRIDHKGTEKCAEIFEKHGEEALFKSNEVTDADIILYLFNRAMAMHSVSCENYLGFCENIDTKYHTNVTDVAVIYLSLADSMLKLNLKKAEKGSKPAETFYDCDTAAIDRALDKIFENHKEEF